MPNSRYGKSPGWPREGALPHETKMALVLPEGLDFVAGEDSPGATLNGCRNNADGFYVPLQTILSGKMMYLVSGGPT